MMVIFDNPAAATSYGDIIAIIQTGGLLAFLIWLIIYAIPNEKWMNGKTVERIVKQEREAKKKAEEREKEWRELALSGTSLADRSISVSEAAVRRARQLESGRGR